MRTIQTARRVCYRMARAHGGGGGGGGGTTTPTSAGTQCIRPIRPAPSAGPGDVSSFFPSAVRFHLVVRCKPLQAPPHRPRTTTARASITISGTKTVLGASTSVFSLSSDAAGFVPIDQYYASSGGVESTAYGNSDSTDLLTSQVVPYAQLLFPVQAGSVSNVIGSGLNIGKDTSGNPITVDVDQKNHRICARNRDGECGFVLQFGQRRDNY